MLPFSFDADDLALQMPADSHPMRQRICSWAACACLFLPHKPHHLYIAYENSYVQVRPTRNPIGSQLAGFAPYYWLLVLCDYYKMPTLVVALLRIRANISLAHSIHIHPPRNDEFMHTLKPFLWRYLAMQCNPNIPFLVGDVSPFRIPQRREPHKRAGQIRSVTRTHTPSIFPNLPQLTHSEFKGKKQKHGKDKRTQCRTEAKVSPLIACFPRLVGVMVAWRIGLYARSRLTKVIPFLLLLLRKAAVTSSWPATFETSRAQLHAVLATHRGTTTPTRVMSGSSPSRSTGTSQKPTRGAASASHNEPGHDLAAHGDLERHCGAPWFC
jgi:hypothetical protein